MNIRRVIFADHYRAHTYAELEELAAEGLLRRGVLARFDPARAYGVAWFGRERVKVTHAKGKMRSHQKRPRSEWVAVPICDPTVPADWVDLARERVGGNRKTPSKGRRFFELAHGLAFCARCGARMSGHALARPNGALDAYSVC